MIEESDGWYPWPYDYEKVFYDVKLKDETILQCCWPNAGKMHNVHATDRNQEIDQDQIVAIREHPGSAYEFCKTVDLVENS